MTLPLGLESNSGQPALAPAEGTIVRPQQHLYVLHDPERSVTRMGEHLMLLIIGEASRKL